MKPNKYTIYFYDGASLEEFAFNLKQAAILAMSRRIIDGKDLLIIYIEDEESEKYGILTSFEFSIIK